MSGYELQGLRDEAAQIGAQLARWEAWTRRLEAMRTAAEGAWQEHSDRLQTLTNEMIALQTAVRDRGTIDVGGYPVTGATGEERLRYELLEARRAAEEERWERWAADQQLSDRTPRGEPYTWSPRRPADVRREQGFARLQMAGLSTRLHEVERQIAELEALLPPADPEPTSTTAPGRRWWSP